jgi:hypothetical protein
VRSDGLLVRYLNFNVREVAKNTRTCITDTGVPVANVIRLAGSGESGDAVAG